jgi:hypothetical protein
LRGTRFQRNIEKGAISSDQTEKAPIGAILISIYWFLLTFIPYLHFKYFRGRTNWELGRFIEAGVLEGVTAVFDMYNKPELPSRDVMGANMVQISTMLRSKRGWTRRK